MEKKFENFSMKDAQRLASTPAGQQLLALLQQQNSPAMTQAMAEASAGNMAGAQKFLSALAEDPRIRQLLSSLQEGSHG